MRKYIDEANMLAVVISTEMRDLGFRWGDRPPRELICDWPGYYRFIRRHRGRLRSAIIATVWVRINLRHWMAE